MYLKRDNVLKKIILIILAVSLILALLSCSKKTEEENSENVFGPTFNVGEVIINLADIGQARYAKVEVVLELDSEPGLEEINLKSPQIRDIIIEIFSAQKAADLLTLEGKDSIKGKIVSRVNQVLSAGLVEEVYFTTIVVQ